MKYKGFSIYLTRHKTLKPKKIKGKKIGLYERQLYKIVGPVSKGPKEEPLLTSILECKEWIKQYL